MLDAPYIRLLMGWFPAHGMFFPGDNISLGQARQVIDNVAFFGEPLRIEEILVHHLDQAKQPLMPRPRLTALQMTPSRNIRRDFARETDLEFVALSTADNPPRAQHDAPDYEHAFWVRGSGANAQIMFMYVMSCFEAATNFKNHVMSNPGMHLTAVEQTAVITESRNFNIYNASVIAGAEFFILGATVFWVSNSIRSVLDPILELSINQFPAPVCTCSVCSNL